MAEWTWMNMFLGKCAAFLVRGYQKFISPWTPRSCRFYPSCSEYSRVSYLRHGFLKGTWQTIARIARCNPFNHGGYDPVPPIPGKEEDTPETYQRLMTLRKKHDSVKKS